MHWHNNVLGLFFARRALAAQQPLGPGGSAWTAW
jgi:hypothetical protein